MAAGSHHVTNCVRGHYSAMHWWISFIFYMNITYDEVLLHVSQIFYLTCLSVCLSVRHAFCLSGGKGLFRNIGFHSFFIWTSPMMRSCCTQVRFLIWPNMAAGSNHVPNLCPRPLLGYALMDFIHFLYEHHLWWGLGARKSDFWSDLIWPQILTM